MKKQIEIDLFPKHAFETYFREIFEEDPNYSDISVINKKTLFEEGYKKGVSDVMKELQEKRLLK